MQVKKSVGIWYRNQAGMTSRLIAALLVLFGLTTLPSMETSAKTETLKFATIHLEPYGFTPGQNSRLGIFQEIHAAIATKAGIPFTDTVMPLKRVLKHVFKGESDCATVIRTPWNIENLELVAEIQDHFQSVVVTRKGLPISQVEYLKGYILALPRGAYAGVPIAESLVIERYYTNGYSQSARVLKAGRVDAIAGSAISIFYNLHRLNMSRADVETILVFDRKALWLHCTKGRLSNDDLDRLRKAADLLRMECVYSDYIKSQSVTGFD